MPEDSFLKGWRRYEAQYRKLVAVQSGKFEPASVVGVTG